MKAILLVNGAGLGNSIRMEQVILELNKQHIECDILCSGNADDYFTQKKINHTTLSQLQYGTSNGKLSIRKTFSFENIKNNIKTINKNNEIIKSLIEKNKYDFAITDSFYSIKFIKNQNIPIYSVNNSNLLYQNFKEVKTFFNFQTKLHFYLIEFFDYLFHLKNVKKSFSLNFFNGKNHFNFIDSPIISKPNLLTNVMTNNVLFMLSGSSWTSQIKISNKSNWLSLINKMFVIGIHKDKVILPQIDSSKVMLIGRTYDATTFINQSQVAVINAGFSAISEMIAAQKPMIIIPLENHSEQQFNAYLIEKLGLGIIANQDNWEDKLKQLIKNFDTYKNNYKKLDPKYLKNGAHFIIETILKDISHE